MNVSLLSQFLWRDVGVALSLMSYRCTLFHGISEIFMNRHVAQVCRVLPSEYEMAPVSQSFSSSVAAGYLDRLEMNEERTTFKRPSMILLSVSKGSFVCPSSCKRRNRAIDENPDFLQFLAACTTFAVVVRSFFNTMTLSLSSSLDNAQMFCKDIDSFQNFIFVFLEMYQASSVSAVDCAFFGMLQANSTLNCSDCFAKFVQLDVAHLF